MRSRERHPWTRYRTCRKRRRQTQLPGPEELQSVFDEKLPDTVIKFADKENLYKLSIDDLINGLARLSELVGYIKGIDYMSEKCSEMIRGTTEELREEQYGAELNQQLEEFLQKEEPELYN